MKFDTKNILWLISFPKMYILIIYVTVKIPKLRRAIKFRNSELTPLLSLEVFFEKHSSNTWNIYDCSDNFFKVTIIKTGYESKKVRREKASITRLLAKKKKKKPNNNNNNNNRITKHPYQPPTLQWQKKKKNDQTPHYSRLTNLKKKVVISYIVIITETRAVHENCHGVINT